MSNTTFTSVKTVREPFSSLRTSKGVFKGSYNTVRPTFIFSPFVAYTTLKSVTLKTDGTDNKLKDNSGIVWSSDSDVHIVAAELRTDKLNNDNLSLDVSSGHIIISNASNNDVHKYGVHVYAVDGIMGSSGNPSSIRLQSGQHLIVSGLSGPIATTTIYYYEESVQNVVPFDELTVEEEVISSGNVGLDEGIESNVGPV